MGTQVDQILAALAQPKQLVQANNEDAIPALQILGTTTLPPEKQARLLYLFAQHDGAAESFWESLAGGPEFNEAQIKEAQNALQLGQLTRNYLPLIRVLKRGSSLQDLAGMSEADWLALIKRNDVGVPDDVPGDTADEKATNYAHELAQGIASEFPTATLAAALVKENSADHSDLIRFFANSPDFDLDTHVDSYLAANDQRASAGIKDKAGLTDQLKKMQRINHVAPRYDHTQVLLSAGIDSANSISSFSEDGFVEQFGDKLGGEAQARAYHAKAKVVTETTAAVFTNVRQAVF
jgi:hypothetical protein